MSKSVNPIPLRPVLGIVLAIYSVLLKMEQLMAWLQSGHHAVSFWFTRLRFWCLIRVIVSVKKLRNALSESITAWHCSFVAQWGRGDFSFFVLFFSYKRQGTWGGSLYTWGPERILLEQRWSLGIWKRLSTESLVKVWAVYMQDEILWVLSEPRHSGVDWHKVK